MLPQLLLRAYHRAVNDIDALKESAADGGAAGAALEGPGVEGSPADGADGRKDDMGVVGGGPSLEDVRAAILEEQQVRGSARGLHTATVTIPAWHCSHPVVCRSSFVYPEQHLACLSASPPVSQRTSLPTCQAAQLQEEEFL